MKKLCLVSAITIMSASAFAYVEDGEIAFYDQGLNKILVPENEQFHSANTYFIEFPKKSLSVEAYQQENFQGPSAVFDNDHRPYAFNKIRSFKVKGAASASHGNPNSLYLRLNKSPSSFTEKCLDLGYFVPGLDKPTVQVGTFCPTQEPQEILDFSQAPAYIQNAKTVRFVVTSTYNSDFITGFQTTWKDKQSALIKKETLMEASGNKVRIESDNVLKITN